jgi:hypothetical protein
MTSVPCPLGCIVSAVEAGVSEKFSAANVAVTAPAAFIVTLHVPVPEQAPLQPVKVDVGFGAALRVTAVPEPKFAEHVLPQLIPSGLLVTIPLPLPASETVSKTALSNFAVIVRLEFTIRLQSIILAVQPPPLQPANTEPELGAAPRMKSEPAETEHPVAQTPGLEIGPTIPVPLPDVAVVTV